MKVIICGSRDWKDETLIRETLGALYELSRKEGVPLIVIHGACRGADMIADKVAAEFESPPIMIKRCPALWALHGKSAGPIRNQRMINDNHFPTDPVNLCVAFHHDINSSRGTADMVNRAKAARIEHVIFPSNGLIRMDCKAP